MEGYVDLRRDGTAGVLKIDAEWKLCFPIWFNWVDKNAVTALFLIIVVDLGDRIYTSYSFRANNESRRK